VRQRPLPEKRPHWNSKGNNYFRFFIFYYFSYFLLSPLYSSPFLPNSDKYYVKTMKVTPLSLRWQLPTPRHYLYRSMELRVSIEAVWEWRHTHGSKPSPTSAINSFWTIVLNHSSQSRQWRSV
jgi:hypothetical protein